MSADKPSQYVPVHKISTYIPVSDELMADWTYVAAWRGERCDYPDATLWRRRWEAARPFTYFSVFANLAPPWEHWEKPRLMTFDPFPTYTRVRTRILRIKWRIQETWGVLRHGLPEGCDC